MYTKIKNMFKKRKKHAAEDVPGTQSQGLNDFLYDTSHHCQPSSEAGPSTSNPHSEAFNFAPMELHSSPDQNSKIKTRVQYPRVRESPQQRSAITDPVVAPGCPPGGICRESNGMMDAYRRRARGMSPSRSPGTSGYDYSPCNPYRSSPGSRSRAREPMYRPGPPVNCLPSDVCDDVPGMSEPRPVMRKYPTLVRPEVRPNAEPRIDRGGGVDHPAPPIATDRNLLDEVAEFYHQFPDLHTEVRIMVANNITIYLLGTNHADPQCPIDVSNIVRRVQPQTVLIELCAWRACGCKDHVGNIFQTKPEFSFRYLRRVISQIGFLPAMIFFTDAFNEHTAAERGNFIDYGAEFAVAAQACNELADCKIVLADREIPITVKRQASAMGNWRGLKVTTLVTLSLLFKSRMRNFLLRGHRLVIRDPHFYQIVVLERDIFLTYMIQAAASLPYPQERPKIVAVVGQGHLNGIQSFWGRVVPQVLPLILKSDIDM